MTLLNFQKRVIIEKQAIVRYNCNGHFEHSHKKEYRANLCNFLQRVTFMSWWHYKFLYFYKPEKLLKIYHTQSTGKNRRALQRRVKRGEKAI